MPIEPRHPAQGHRPRVLITFDQEIDGIQKSIELPFVIGVLAGFSGKPRSTQTLRERKFLEVTPHNLDEILARIGPRLHLRVPNRLSAQPQHDELFVQLRFLRFADFEPAGLTQQVPALKNLLTERNDLQMYLDLLEQNQVSLPSAQAWQQDVWSALRACLNPPPSTPSPSTPKVERREVEEVVKLLIAAIDQRLSNQLNAILHHPDFQRLESTWRGLKYLVDRCVDTDRLKVKILDISKQELANDLDAAPEFDQSYLFKRVYEDEYGTLGGEPYGLLLGDYEFDASSEDLKLLRQIAQVSACAHAPFVASTSPRMFGTDRFAALALPRQVAPLFETMDYAPWRSLREREDCRYVALTLPRVLARVPYRGHPLAVRDFVFEEQIETNDVSCYLWMNSSWAYAACVAAAFVRDGWFVRTRGAEGGGRVEGLPLDSFPTDPNDVALKSSIEVIFSDRREDELSSLGFLPLVHSKNRRYLVFVGAQSLQKPKRYNLATANANAELSTKMHYILSVSRFAHYLKVLARNKIGVLQDQKETELWLNDWLRQYVIGNPESVSEEVQARRPLSAAEVKLQPMPGRPGWYSVVALLKPHYQLESLTATMRLVAEIPKTG